MQIDKTVKEDDAAAENTNTTLIPNRDPVAILENIDAYISTIFNSRTFIGPTPLFFLEPGTRTSSGAGPKAMPWTRLEP